MCQLRGLGGGRPDPLPLWISFSARPSPYLGAPFSRGLPHQSCVKASCGGGGGTGEDKMASATRGEGSMVAGGEGATACEDGSPR
jgi:hypothetical protein